MMKSLWQLKQIKEERGRKIEKNEGIKKSRG